MGSATALFCCYRPYQTRNQGEPRPPAIVADFMFTTVFFKLGWI